MKSFSTFALIGVCSVFAIAAAARADTINLCSGATDGPYDQIAHEIANNLRGSGVEVRVVSDTGGTWGNIERTTRVSNSAQPTQADYDAGTACHAFIGQPDGLSALKRKNPAEANRLVTVGKLHTEYLQALCNKDSGYTDIGELGGRDDVSIAVGDSGSGAWLIWENFIAEDSSYGTVPTKSLSGPEAVAAVANGDVTCMLVPAGIPNKTVSEADELFGDQLVLAGVNDKDFNDAVDTDGKSLYTWAKIPSGTYSKHLQGWFSGKNTVSWNARVVMNTERITDQKVKAKLITAVARVRPWAQATFGGGQ